jgi:predicted ATPase
VRRADIPDLLAALVDKSLLGLEDDGPRYRMLETIREFGIDRLAERGELNAVRTAHARFFADLTIDLVPQLRDRRQRTALRVIAAEHDNVLAALRHLLDRGEAEPALTLVVALNQYWGLTGRHTEALAWLELALRLPDEGSRPGSLADGRRAAGDESRDHGRAGRDRPGRTAPSGRNSRDPR